MGIMRRGRLGWGWVEAGRGWLGGAGATERGFLLHWGGAKTKGLFFVLARRCRPLADMSPARVGFNAPSSKNSRLIFAQQPRPNDKRNPLHHVLRTAGTGRAFEGGALRGGGGGARSCGRGREGSGFGVQGKRSECRGQRSGKTEQPEQPEQPFNAKGANETQTTQAGEEREKPNSQQPHGRTRTVGEGRIQRSGAAKGRMAARVGASARSMSRRSTPRAMPPEGGRWGRAARKDSSRE